MIEERLTYKGYTILRTVDGADEVYEIEEVGNVHGRLEDAMSEINDWKNN